MLGMKFLWSQIFQGTFFNAWCLWFFLVFPLEVSVQKTHTHNLLEVCEISGVLSAYFIKDGQLLWRKHLPMTLGGRTWMKNRWIFSGRFFLRFVSLKMSLGDFWRNSDLFFPSFLGWCWFFFESPVRLDWKSITSDICISWCLMELDPCFMMVLIHHNWCKIINIRFYSIILVSFFDWLPDQPQFFWNCNLDDVLSSPFFPNPCRIWYRFLKPCNFMI